MTLAVVVTASLVLAVLTADHRWRPLALGGAFLIRIGLPSIVGDISFFGALPTHVSTVLIISYAAIWPLGKQGMKLNAQESIPRIPFVCHVVLGMVAVGSILMSGSLSAMASVAGFVLNQIVAPYAFCILVYNTFCQHESLYKNAGRLFASVCVFESVVALAVKFQVIPQPYLSAYPSALISWISLGTRLPATLDHPLTLGLLLAAGIPMTAYFRSRTTAYFAVFMMMVGISLTQSRIAAAGALVGLAYLLIIGSKSLLERFNLILMAAVGYTFLYMTGFLEGVLGRIQDDKGSSRARTNAFQMFRDTWSDFKVSGVGIQLSKEYFLSHGLGSSGESAAISYSVGIGIPLTLLYFSLIIWMIVRGIQRGKSLAPSSIAAIIVFGSLQFYNSIATESAAAMILWTTIGLALAVPQTVARSSMHDINSTIPYRGRRTASNLPAVRSVTSRSVQPPNPAR
jgi:hypothetical protein